MTVKLCIGCSHFNSQTNGCRRNIIGIDLDRVRGEIVYKSTKELNCYRERASWFGCRKSGRYWNRHI